MDASYCEACWTQSLATGSRPLAEVVKDQVTGPLRRLTIPSEKYILWCIYAFEGSCDYPNGSIPVPGKGGAVATTRVFKSGNSQAVRLPKEFAVMGKELEIPDELSQANLPKSFQFYDPIIQIV